MGQSVSIRRKISVPKRRTCTLALYSYNKSKKEVGLDKINKLWYNSIIEMRKGGV